MNKEVELRHPISSLVSFHYFAKTDIQQMHSWGLRMIGDSGAFSALTQGTPINIEAFSDWATKWKRHLFWVASLDVIGDAKKSRSNYEYLRGKGIEAVPTVHYGSDPKLITDYAKDGVDFIGLGGMVGRKSEPQKLLRWTLSMFKYAKDNHPEVRFHGWGTTHPQLVNNLPWFSVDSSGFSSAYRYGRLSLFNESSGKRIGITLDGKDAFNHSDLLVQQYGISPDRVAKSTSGTRRDLVRLSVLSVQKQEDHLRKRFSVSPPRYGLNESPTGPNVHFVDAAKVHLSMLKSHAPNMHVALGFPNAQSTRSVSPTDELPNDSSGPNMHVAGTDIKSEYGYMKNYEEEKDE